ncbi:citramalate synthase [Clostridium felsineum]|uniref:citramalate synthase n=1 Tax=Clostridium felsineum TaxID=36839 RepID=UPI00098C1134|nr:citramalate synthase [Clostridium felsineum]URZ14723.1 (R)-citramalate synthase [Clostridium felsineum DSM 794]
MGKEEKVYMFDSILRDGSQAQGVSFSVTDKIKIVKKLDEMGIDYIEAGNPSSNPKDREFFEEIKSLKFLNSKLCAFGSTRRSGIKAEEDEGLEKLINSGADVLAIFGKAWDFQVTDIIKTSLSENLNMIGDSIEYLVSLNKEVVFDAEHFFDGFKNNKEYSIEVLNVAKRAGAKWIVLCDTNGGTMPNEVIDIIQYLVKDLKFDNIGVHFHDDAGMAVANSIMAVHYGVRHVQGTFTGVGERCGNANLSSIIANLSLKMDYTTIKKDMLEYLTVAFRYISEACNMTPNERTPYVGNCAFSHKGGMHIDAVRKNPKSFEHINPAAVGNSRRILVSEVSGRSTILPALRKINPKIDKDSPETKAVVKRVKDLEYIGYQFEGAEGSFELLMRKELNVFKPSFKLIEYKVIAERPYISDLSATAIVKIMVNGKLEITAADGKGPVNALDKALRKALGVFYKELADVYLTDYKVRVISGTKATSAKIRVLIESTDGISTWTTVGVSYDIIEASWLALVDSVEYKLIQSNKEE